MIFTGLIGVFIFGRNTFLLVITVLSGYVSYSGFQVLKTKSNKVRAIDISTPIIALAVLAYFLYYFQSIGMIWSPIVIYSTVGALLAVILYDLLKFFIPLDMYKRNRIWLYEHIYKLVSAFSALLSAFAGTVLVSYQPHSQYLPSALGVMIIMGFMIYVRKSGLKLWKSEPK